MTPRRIKKLPEKKHFAFKFLRNTIVAVFVIGFSLVIGIIGYMYFFKLDWVDGLYNASMILTGMGPVDKPVDNAGKVFASCYALYSGVAFLSSIALLFGPVVHRFLHKFHLDIEDNA